MGSRRSQFDRIAEIQAKEGVMGDGPTKGCTNDRHEGVVERTGTGWTCHYCGRRLDG